jgi:diguanylate cyclase (GGDEF)-like protein/PAS domain S-box-containing protein
MRAKVKNIDKTLQFLYIEYNKLSVQPVPMKILIVEDNPADHRLFREMLGEVQHAPYELLHANRLSAALQRLEQETIDVVFLDLGLPDSQGLNTFQRLYRQIPDIPIVVLSGEDNEEWAVEAVRQGAQDYLIKGEVNGALLLRSMRYACERMRFRQALSESETKYRALFESAGDGIGILTREGEFVDCNARTLQMFHVPRAALIGKTPADFSPPLQPDGTPSEKKVMEMLRAALAGTPQFFEWNYILPDQTDLDVEVGLSRIELQGVPHLQAVARDISERKKVEEELRRTNQEMALWVAELEKRNQQALMLNEMGNLLQSCLADDEVCTVLGQYADRLFPGLAGALYRFNAGRDLLELAYGWGENLQVEEEFPPEACWALRRGRTHMVTAPSYAQLHCQHLGENVSTSYLCLPLSAQGETLGLLYLQEGPDEVIQRWETLGGIVAERLALAVANLKLRETLRTQSVRDALTGLLNRRYMEETLDRELRRAAADKQPLGLVLVDLDNFSAFNRNFGHDAGDAILRALGAFIKTCLRADDMACRSAGEEFLLVFPETDLAEVCQRGELLCEGIKKLHVYDAGRPLEPVSASIGAAVFPESGSNREMLLVAVQAAMIQARAAGGGQVVAAPNQ